MDTKNRTFIEDSIILIIVCVSIYFIYNFFFVTPENITISTKEVIKEDPRVQEKPKEQNNIAEEIQKAKIFLGIEDTKPEELQETTQQEVLDKDTMQTTQIVKPNIAEPLSNNLLKDKKYKSVKEFYLDIQKIIYDNIQKNVDKSNIPASSVKIRITILKNGDYEQLKFMGGNKQYYNAIKSSIYETFPVYIDPNIKHKFPRYFRITVEY